MDTLQNKIRKTKNPVAVVFLASQDRVPGWLLEGRSFLEAYGIFCRELLAGLKGVAPAVRFAMGSFLLRGEAGVKLLMELMKEAGRLGYYVLADLPQMLSPAAAENVAESLGGDSIWHWDGAVVCPYLGTDILKPFTALCREEKKDLFVVLRTSNKSAPELQDLITGARLVHIAAADLVNSLGHGLEEKCGYSRVAAVAAACGADSLRNLRSKYKQSFLLVDGYDYPGGNAKNSSLAFDELGHGAAVCVEQSVTAAWKQSPEEDRNFVQPAIEAAQRIKKNLSRYMTIL